MAEIRVTAKKGAGAYVKAVEFVFSGGGGEEAAVDEVVISALGNAIGRAVAVAAQLERAGTGSIAGVRTEYTEMGSALTPRIAITMQRGGAAAQGQAPSQAAVRAPPASVGVHALQGERSYMEDRAVAHQLPEALFAAVYDGHVGEAAAEFCAAQLHQVLAKHLKDGGADLDGAFARTFTETNDAFLAQAGDDVSGTTACVVLRLGGTLHVANAGDCRCVVFGADGPEQVTEDHRPDNANEYARIEGAGWDLFDPEDGAGSRVCGPDGAMLACSRSIGDRHFKPVVTCEPDTFTRPIKDTDVFAIIASDGVWDDFTNQKACNLVKEALNSGTPQDAAEALCQATHKAGAEDNISAVVIRLNS